MMGKVDQVVCPNEGKLWHKRLGHLHHGALKVMQHISTGLPKGTLVQLDPCKGCIMGKYAKATFQEKENRASKVLERFHSDVCGPFYTASIEKHKYYVIFFDDFSQKCWIYFMQKKDQAFSNFLEFKALVEKDTGKHMKDLRSENGGEYISNEFKKFCSKEVI